MARSVYLDEGIRLFNAGEYYLAHETLEEHWVEAPAAERDFLQGLIHLAIGFHHMERENKKGATLQFQKSLKRLDAYPDEFIGVDVEGIRVFLRSAPGLLEQGAELQKPELS